MSDLEFTFTVDQIILEKGPMGVKQNKRKPLEDGEMNYVMQDQCLCGKDNLKGKIIDIMRSLGDYGVKFNVGIDDVVDIRGATTFKDQLCLVKILPFMGDGKNVNDIPEDAFHNIIYGQYVVACNIDRVKIEKSDIQFRYANPSSGTVARNDVRDVLKMFAIQEGQ